MLFAAVASFASTAWAQGVIYSIQNGPWSSPSTWWGGTVPNCSYVVVKHAVTIDQNIGTNCGGSKWIRIEPGGVLTVNNSSPRTISFGSSGTNPIGSGNAYNPGADANMFGFFVSGGVLDLEGAPGHWVTLTSANDWSPIYIHHQGWDYAGCTTMVSRVCNGGMRLNGAALKFRYVNARHLGTSTQYYDGITWDMESGTYPSNALDIQYSQFTDLYEIVHYWHTTSGGGYNFSNNTITGTRGQYTVFAAASDGSSGWIVTNNTESGALVPGKFLVMYAAPANMTFSQNAELGTATIQRGLLKIAALSGGGGSTISNNLCYNPEGAVGPNDQCISFTSAPSDTSQITGNVLNGTASPIAVLGGSPRITTNWLNQYKEASSGQGDVIVYGHSVVPYVAYNINLIDSDDWSIGSLMISSNAYQQRTSAQSEHNTYIGTGNSRGLYVGEGSIPDWAAYNNYARSNLVVGGYMGIVDGNPYNTWNSSTRFNGAGVHHNDVFNARYPYSSTVSSGFDDGVHRHPSSLYGDITADPMFNDSSRRPPAFDATLGGNGTMTHFFAQLANRNGFNGNYDSRYSIVAMLNWLQQGFAPKNTALKGAAHDGTDIGAVPVIVGRSGGN